MNLHYIEIGNQSSDQTIIFLHEGLGSVEMWKDYPEKLCNALNLKGIVYDRAGYGKSPGNLKNRKSDYLHIGAAELYSLVVRLRIKSPILYGHSDGGTIALIYAATYPESCKAVITEAAHVFNEAVTIEGVKAARPLIEDGKMDALKKYHGERYKEVFYAWNDIWLDESFKNWNVTPMLANATCPQLIIQGKDDQYGTLKQVETIAEQTTGQTTQFTPDNCGHAPHKERTESVLEEVKKFIHDNI